jgi:hypothetical protein
MKSFYSIVLVRLFFEYYKAEDEFIESKLCYISSQENTLRAINIEGKGKQWEGTRCFLSLNKAQKRILEELLCIETNTFAIRLKSFWFKNNTLYIQPIDPDEDNWCISPAKHQWKLNYKNTKEAPVAIFYGPKMKFLGTETSFEAALTRIKDEYDNPNSESFIEKYKPEDYVLAIGNGKNLKFLNIQQQILY